MRTEKQHKNIVALSDIRRERQIALSPYGPVRAGLTTSPKTSAEVQLMELLNSLEKIVQDLNYKSFTVYDTLNTAIEDLRAALLDTTSDEDGTDETP